MIPIVSKMKKFIFALHTTYIGRFNSTLVRTPKNVFTNGNTTGYNAQFTTD